MARKEKTVIGRTATASFPSEGIYNIPVKIDTGADRSSIWVSNLSVDDSDTLHFVLFDKMSPYYSGKLHSTRHYTAQLIRSSNGTAQVRYRVSLTVELAGRLIRGSFTLADRSRNTYPVLVGCALLKNKFLVDVALESPIQPPIKYSHKGPAYDEELRRDPKAFFKKYHQHNRRGDVEL